MRQSQGYIRGLAIMGFIGLVMVIFLVKIFILQLPSRSRRALVEIAKQNIRVERLRPERGYIYDRKGRVLAANKYVYELYVTPYYLPDTMIDVDLLASYLGLDTLELREKVQQVYRTRNVVPFKSRLLARYIQPQNAAKFLEQQYKFQGFYLLQSYVRFYPAHVAAHALGYVRLADKQDIENDSYYELGDFIGKRGLEAYYEKFLRGKKGVRRWLVTSTGRIVGPYQGGKTDTLPQPGKSLTTSIDLDLQRYAEFLMKNKPGALVAIEPKTGQILAYVSSPYYDPNLLTGKDLSKNYDKLRSDHILSPLFNRPIQSDENPPGSTFKVVQALCALQEGIINDKTTFFCPGGYYFQGISIKCHMHRTPYVDFYYSIQASCNTYYCNVYQHFMLNKKFKSVHQAYQTWYNLVWQFGIGHQLGIDIPGEMPGVLYDTTILNTAYRGRWGFHDIVHIAIGQGKVGVTPLQLANIAATVANRGYYITPHFGVKIGDSVLTYDTNYVDIDSSYFNKVVHAMSLVFEPGGTAAFSKIPGLKACGKTGTAQNPPSTGKDDNSIFIAFAPMDNPEIAVAVYVEEGGPGSQTAAPIASLLIQKYLLDTIVRPDLYIARVKDKNIVQKILQRENAKNRSANKP